MPRRRLSESSDLPWEETHRVTPQETVVPAPVPGYLERSVARLVLAQRDPNVFMETVIRGEERKEPIVQGAYHRELQDWFTRHDHLVHFGPAETGKSVNLYGRVLWEIGRNTSIHVAYASGTMRQSIKFAKAVREYVEEDPIYHAVFPHVRKPTREGSPWTQTQLEVDRPPGSRDPTLGCYQACAPSITGARLDLVILDDVLTQDNTRTPEQREKVQRWIDGLVESRLLPGGKVWIVGQPYHPGDAMHVLEKRGDAWAAYRRPLVAGGASLWPERWDAERIAKKMRTMPPLEFARMYMCQARDDAQQRFHQSWFDRALMRGRGLTLPFRYRGPQDPMWMTTSGKLVTVAGVDLAVGRRAENDETSIVTLALHPNGDRQLLFVESGRWTAREIIEKIKSTWRRYDCQVIFVDAVAAQAYLVELLAEESECPVEGFVTTGAKHDPVYGFEQAAIELNNGKWILPSDAATGTKPLNEEEEKLISEMLWYSPSEHTGDRASALYFAREAAKSIGGGATATLSLVR